MDYGEEFEIRQPLTPESLQAFLDLYFPDRKSDPYWTRLLLEDLKKYKIELIDVLDYYLKVKDFLLEREKEEIERINSLPIYDRPNYDGIKYGEDYKGWQQVGIINLVLDLSDDDFWQGRQKEMPIPEKHKEKINRWRKLISDRKKQSGSGIREVTHENRNANPIGKGIPN